MLHFMNIKTIFIADPIIHFREGLNICGFSFLVKLNIAMLRFVVASAVKIGRKCIELHTNASELAISKLK